MSDETTLVRTIGRYHALSELGRGAMGVVYKGYDPTIGRTVALKTIAFGAADEQAREFRRRLYVEASAAGALTHPNIVTIYDVIEDGHTTAVAMEFVEGQTLAAMIAREGPLALDRALDIFEQICAALDYAGSKGIVHRDIKPANVLVGADGRPKIADFGIARLPTSHATMTGMVLGSPSYMSPEQVRGLPLDPRSDLFSAATLLYEMLTKQNPFGSDDVATTMYRIVHEPAVPSCEINPAIGPEVAAVLERGLAKDPTQRYGTGAELISALRRAAAARIATSTATALAGAEQPPPRPLSHRIELIVGALGLATALVVGVLQFHAHNQPPAAVPTAQPAQSSSQMTSSPVVASAPVAPVVPQPNAPPTPTPDRAQPPAASSATASKLTASRPADRQRQRAEDLQPAGTRRSAEATAASSAAAPSSSTSSVTADSLPPARTSAAASVAARPATARAWLDVEFAGQTFPIQIYAGDRQVGQVAGGTELGVQAGEIRIRAVAESVYFDRDYGTMTLGAGERHRLQIPGLASAVIGVKGDTYTGLRIFLDERPLPGPYPAQIPRIAAGTHVVRFSWLSGTLAGKELKQPIDTIANGHFLIRADPDNDKIVPQQVR